MPRPESRTWLLPSCLAVFAALNFLHPRPCSADDTGGITVTGIGTVKTKPTVAEIRATISGEGELAADANVKYLDAKKKALASMNALNNPDLSVESQGPTVGQATDPATQMRVMQGMATDMGKQRVQVAEDLNIHLKNVDKLDSDKLVQTVMKIIDAGRDAGMQVGPAPARNYYQMQMEAQNGEGDSIVVFKLADKSQAEKQAYQKAVEDARDKAQRIADLNGIKLGRILSVEDQQTSDNTANQGGGTNSQTDTGELSSASLTEIPVTVSLVVKFEIADQSETKK